MSLACGYLHADDDARPEQVFPFYHQVALDLPEEFPPAAQGIAVFVAHMDAAQHLVPVRTERAAYAQVTVVVAAAQHTRLVGRAHAPCVVAAPERIGADMMAVRTFTPFQIEVAKELFSPVFTYSYIDVISEPTQINSSIGNFEIYLAIFK